MTSLDLVLFQLQAATSAADAAALNARLALQMYQDSNGMSEVETPLTEGLDTTDCPHLQKEDASVMNLGGEQKDYCASCRHYIYQDGRTEAAT